MEQKTKFPASLVYMTRADFDSLVEENASRRVADIIKEKGLRLAPLEQDAGDDRLLTREATAEMLHVDSSTLWRWDRSGVLRARRIGKRKVVYRYCDVLAAAKREGRL